MSSSRTAMIAVGTFASAVSVGQPATAPLTVPSVATANACGSQREPRAATCPDETVATDASASESSPPSNIHSPFVVSATYIGEAAGNTAGGLRRDVAFAGRILLRSDVALGRLMGLSGGTLHVWFSNRQGRNLVDFALGTSTGIQEIYSPQSSVLSVLTYEQDLFSGRLELEAGRLPANLSFLSSPLCAYLQTNSACGSPTFVFKTSNLTFFPPSSWGARAKGRLSDRTYAHAGVYEVNPDRTRPTATGFEWSVKNATG